jgi:hypothetical protein
MAKYQDPSLEFSDIVAYAGIGTYAALSPDGQRLGGIGTMTGIANAAYNLGAPFTLGLAENGYDSIEQTPGFKEKAIKVIYFNSGDDALNYLKTVIASGHPVELQLDNYYVYDDVARVSTFWQSHSSKQHTGLFWNVTGYDEERIYLNNPNDSTEAAINVPVSVGNFILAWEKIGEQSNITSPLTPKPLGPYWMVYLSQMGNKKSADEVIPWSVKLSKTTPSDIRKFGENSKDDQSSRLSLRRLAISRLVFANFLVKHSKDQVSDLYRKSGNMFAVLADRGPKAVDLRLIADIEEQALGLLVK